ncbi:DUF4255 domain-containing protein [Streptomyces sp. Caat 7-52]|uniref:DUF4255 domain-containing protein n=1 Tax=Streptomyces sp. Caat 7-52 TaxID=2949637 RepID=UPI0020356C5D|nr:DUF4255 domain-containing protein [Streptomyces sp. Caat 7-52]
MSNSLAVAAVTSTMRFVLDRALQTPHPGPVGNARVTTVRPDRLGANDMVHPAGINVYLYQVTPNHAWNLTDLPTRRDDGSYLRRPVCALDLHYLVTSYGEDPSLDAQRLLGLAVTALARTPVLTPAVVAAATEAYEGTTATAFLKHADLVNQIESVKISPAVHSLEDLSRLWSVFPQTPYELSLGYTATVVLLEAEVSTRAALPVRQPVIALSSTGGPRLTAAEPVPPRGFAATGGSLLLRGSGLTGPLTKVRVGPALLNPESGAAEQAIRVRLDLTVPAGLHAVQVVQLSPPGPEGRPPARVLATSNALPVTLRPTVTRVSTDGGHISIGLQPPLTAGQRATVFMTRIAASTVSGPDALSFVLPPLPAGSPPQPSVDVPRDQAPAGEWLVRVQVDGAESLPQPVGEVYGAPSITLPAT